MNVETRNQIVAHHKCNERKRIAFVVNRDGIAKAREWARRVYRQYRSAILRSARRGYAQPHYASFREWRPMFIASCVELRKFIRA